MAPLKPLLRRLLDGDSEPVVHECRNCGTSVDDEHDVCPNCESDRIASHRLE